MISLLTLLVVWNFICPSFGSFINICTKNKESLREPLLAALLDLHSGEHCDHPNVASFQQLAVLESTVKQINEEKKVKIGFQVFDTCSSEQGAVTASMQAFVASQQTCLHSPLFTGFIGPENVNYLKAVKNFTRSFNFTHIVGYSLPDHNLSESKAVYVTEYPVRSFAQAIEGLIQTLELKSPIVLTDPDTRSQAIASLLRNNRNVKAVSDVCTTRIEHMISNPSDLEELITFRSSTHDGIVIIVENDEIFKSINRILDSASIQDPVIIVDLKNSALQKDYSWNDNVLIVNQIGLSESGKNMSSMSLSVSNAIHSFVTDSNRICGKHKLTTCNNKLLSTIMEEEYDWTLQLYRMAVLLLGSAVEEAQKLKCNSKQCMTPNIISQNEWHDILSTSTINTDTRQNKNRISFNMALPASYIIKTSFGPEGLKKIGHIEGKTVSLTSSDYLPVRVKNVSCPTVAETIDMVTTVPAVPLDFFDSLFDPKNAKLFEAVGLVSGAIVGILLVMLLFTSCVYKNFKAESSPRSPSSHTTMSRAGTVSS